MMAVIEPQFQRDFISLLPKGKKNCTNVQICPEIVPEIVPKIAPEIVPEVVPEIRAASHPCNRN